MSELASQPTSVQTVYTWFREGKLFVNRRYQRKLVWTQEEKQKLIESLIRRYPVPAILIAEREAQPGTYEIIDGLQRLHSIVSFIENAFPLLDGKYFEVKLFPTAKAAADTGAFDAKAENFISAKEVSAILDYSLALSVMRNATEIEINDVFDRINTYGHRLSDQERRQAGVQNEFSSLVRELACTLRGDSSETVLKLEQMPSISIDLPMSNHGYEVKADEIFWVNHGILRSTDLRDSLDEQCIADIAACIVRGDLIERSKDALDDIYNRGTDESERVLSALDVYGKEKLSDEIKYCIGEILKVCTEAPAVKLRHLLFERANTNAFPAVFAVLMIAFHEKTFESKAVISDYAGIRRSLEGLSARIETGRKSTSIEERRKNINVIKGLIDAYFIKDEKVSEKVYGNHTSIDISSMIRRSEIELSNFEFKQGILSMKKDGNVDHSVLLKIVKTICAIANNGPNQSGKILIGVADTSSDAERAKQIDGIVPMKIGKKYIVGVDREIKRLGKNAEQYYAIIRDYIKGSGLSSNLKDTVLSHMDYDAFYGLGVIVISVVSQNSLSYVGDELYFRSGNSTELAKGARQIAELAGRFAGRASP